MTDILEMGRKELLKLKVEADPRPLKVKEVTHIATTLGAFWEYDYAAAGCGRVGKHALLKSGLHGNGFFVSRILLAHRNVLDMFSHQILLQLQRADVPLPNYVGGVPTGATALAANIAENILGVSKMFLEKIDGRIRPKRAVRDGATVLLVEDFCTRGTGFAEAVHEISEQQPSVKILPYCPVIINRGGMREISVKGVGAFTILAVAEKRIWDWTPGNCPLCGLGSVAIRPKETDENWRLLTTSQLE